MFNRDVRVPFTHLRLQTMEVNLPPHGNPSWDWWRFVVQ